MGLLRTLAGVTQSKIKEQWQVVDDGAIICKRTKLNSMIADDGTVFFVPHDIVTEVSHFNWEQTGTGKVRASIKGKDIYMSLNSDMIVHPTFGEILEMCYCLCSDDYNISDSVKYKDNYLDTVLKCSYASIQG